MAHPFLLALQEVTKREHVANEKYSAWCDAIGEVGEAKKEVVQAVGPYKEDISRAIDSIVKVIVNRPKAKVYVDIRVSEPGRVCIGVVLATTMSQSEQDKMRAEISERFAPRWRKITGLHKKHFAISFNSTQTRRQ